MFIVWTQITGKEAICRTRVSGALVNGHRLGGSLARPEYGKHRTQQRNTTAKKERNPVVQGPALCKLSRRAVSHQVQGCPVQQVQAAQPRSRRYHHQPGYHRRSAHQQAQFPRR